MGEFGVSANRVMPENPIHGGAVRTIASPAEKYASLDWRRHQIGLLCYGSNYAAVTLENTPMKNILARPELLAAVKDFVADPTNEFPKNEVGKPHGFTQKQQMSLELHLLMELGVFRDDLTGADIGTIATVLYDLGNASAARQSLEKATILAETPGGGKRGADPVALAAKWMPKVAPAATAPAPAAPAAS